jgi:hypothetical protein
MRIRGATGGWYVLVAGIIRVVDEAGAVEAMSGLLLSGQRRLHWRSESTRRRAEVLAAINQLGIKHVAVVGRSLDRRGQERARRKCLEVLLWELAQQGVDEITIESRGAVRDHADRQVLTAYRRTGVMPGSTTVGFTGATGAPLLWVPDAVAGAVASAPRTEGQQTSVANLSMHCIDLLSR